MQNFRRPDYGAALGAMLAIMFASFVGCLLAGSILLMVFG